MTHTPPDPLDALWLFDGVCNLCSGSVALVLKLDRGGVVRFTPIQSSFGRQLAAANGIDPEHPASFVFFDRGRPLEKTAAIGALLRRLRPPWRWLAGIDRLPRRAMDRAYDWLAANRYRLLGQKAVCMVPTPEVRARFILDPPGDLRVASE
ncbi:MULTISPECIES: thiol-disulfide oxidoreductase DCC family protein [unclassified Caulobacter]|uniref:thiol-disulfide oxidoreductase DCC family protein n=1 Tax=unclassified Caulobacter TaxID=2648921 RepID=UPI000D38987C|nr:MULTISPECIES: DCC1-like thiol-disulfide oxidoreductase family protein [unclassified Caulobacter]PTS91587.1 thiol-disulfide oxidoreductase DCC family protein [Caulobacter sp. HMWF009]PTT07413.1 thiol-disulfide oxidoreductase DCC family protein [Caulobacter sp. HMWF025]